MKGSKWFVPLSVLGVFLIIVSLLAYGIHRAFFDIQRINGGEILTESQSIDGTYTVTAYLNNGGATTGYAVLCSVKNNKTSNIRNIYWNYPCDKAVIQWIDDTNVSINGIELDVTRDTYDYRKN